MPAILLAISLLLDQTQVAPEQFTSSHASTTIAFDQAYKLCRGRQLAAQLGDDTLRKEPGKPEVRAGYFLMGWVGTDGRTHAAFPCVYYQRRIGVQQFTLDGSTLTFELVELPAGAIPWLVQQQAAAPAPSAQYGATRNLKQDTDWSISGSVLTLTRPFSAGDALVVEWDR